MPEEIINHGVLLGQRPEDWIAGAISGIPFEIRNPKRDWRPYLVKKEYQKAKEDSMSCVSFSAISAIEMQEKFLTGKESNYSDRFIAKMSGTTKDGNYLYKVGDAIRNLGLVKEESYPAPPNFTFAQYHAPISEPKLSQLLAEGQEWKQRWEVRTEFINNSIGIWYNIKEDLMHHLQQAPLQIVIPGHAIVNIFCEADVAHYLDTYNPFEKKTPYSKIQTAYKLLLTPKGNQNMARVVRDDKGVFHIEFGVEGKKVSLGINDEEFAKKIVDSGEPVTQVNAITAKPMGVIEKGLIIDQD